MNGSQASRVALVTGGAVRVGRAICLELAAAGFDVAIHYRSSRAAAEEVAAEITKVGRQARLLQADLADAETAKRLIDDAVAWQGRLDVLVNNAAVFDPDDLDAWEPVRAEQQVSLNLLIPMHLCAFAAAQLKQSGAGSIVNIVDARVDRPMRGYASYTAAKAGLVGLTRSLARDLAPAVRVNAVAPGVAVFPESMPEADRNRILRRVPLGRAGRPQDVAEAVRYLIEAHYVTGEVLVVDGGQSLE